MKWKRIVPDRLGYFHIFLVGLILRVIYLYQAWHNNELIDYPLVDARIYVDWARSILRGNWLWHQPSNYTPMYPLYVSGWLRLFGRDIKTIFTMFHLLGALQAVIIGKTAEAVWNRRVGLLSSFIAATYWPFIIHEATFYAENLALWTAGLGLLLLCQYSNRPKNRLLLGAGLFMGFAGLCRVNMFLCFAAIGAWLVWHTARNRTATGGALGRNFFLVALQRVCLFLLPILFLSAPIMIWNYHLTGAPILRTQAGSCLYLGNNPDYGGLIVSPGVEWHNLVNAPLRAGQTVAEEKERYWMRQTLEIIQNRTREWARLQVKKLAMHLGAFEISQEIDIYRFRGFSSVLNLPIWPGFGFVGPLAIVGIILSMARRESHAVLLWLFVLAYLISLFPFQVASRFRLPAVVALIPFCAYGLTRFAGTIRSRDYRWSIRAALLLALVCALLLPDHTDLKTRNVIKHWFLVGLKRSDAGDKAGALAAFRRSATEHANDADSLLRIGHNHLANGNIEHAEASYLESRRRLKRNAEALLGLARCAYRRNATEEAIRLAHSVFDEAPNSKAALELLRQIYSRQENWEMARGVLRQMRSYINHPADVVLRLAIVNERLGSYNRAIALYDEQSKNPRFSAVERDRAAFFAGVLLWRHHRNVQEARRRWQRVVNNKGSFGAPLAACLLKALGDAEISGLSTEDVRRRRSPFALYTSGLAAWLRGDMAVAREFFGNVVANREATKLQQHELTILEFWALADLEKLSAAVEPVE